MHVLYETTCSLFMRSKSLTHSFSPRRWPDIPTRAPVACIRPGIANICTCTESVSRVVGYFGCLRRSLTSARRVRRRGFAPPTSPTRAWSTCATGGKGSSPCCLLLTAPLMLSLLLLLLLLLFCCLFSCCRCCRVVAAATRCWSVANAEFLTKESRGQRASSFPHLPLSGHAPGTPNHT